ncbi:MAG TPA: hypothetical protein EYP61_05915 [Candidatus Latescibacteria bacterium]|nr:hypothetical protein [Candidatus Latescibacterota bacterium]
MIWLYIVLLGTAYSHRLDEIGIGRQISFFILPDRIKVTYALGFAPIMAFPERRKMDVDGDGMVQEEEARRYAEGLGKELSEGISVKLDGRPIKLHCSEVTVLLMDEERVGPFPFEVDVVYRCPLGDLTAGAHEVVLKDSNYRGFPGWLDPLLQGALGVDRAFVEAKGEGEVRVRFVTGRDEGEPGKSVLPGRPGGLKAKLESVIKSPTLSPKLVALAVAIAFFLGAAHALEPGHGKAVVAAYLIGSRGTPLHALALGLVVTATHTVGVFVLGALALFASRYIVPQRLFPILGAISGLLITGVGIWLLVRYLSGSHHDHEHHDHERYEVSWRSLFSLGISGGLVPCPGALVILLTAVALNRIALGLGLIVLFSLGLASVLITIGMLTVLTRSFIARFTGEGKLVRYLPPVSSVVIILLGLVITFRSLTLS